MDTNWKTLDWIMQGIATINLFPEITIPPHQTDSEAIASDWDAIGRDFREVIRVNSWPFVVKK